MGRLKRVSELDDPEAMAILALECSEDLLKHDATGKKIRRTVRFKFMDRVAALTLLGKACHFYADRRDERGPYGSQSSPNVTVSFIHSPISPEEAYRRLRGRPAQRPQSTGGSSA
jgi:hypothetical protein